MKPIYVALPPNTYVALMDFLAESKLPDDPTDIIDTAVWYWIENAGWKEDMAPSQRAHRQPRQGYHWKTLFLPHGTKLRMRYRTDYHYAEVIEDDLVFDGEKVSPSEFTFKVTNTSRNAWRDIEVMRPNDSQWRVADILRRGGD